MNKVYKLVWSKVRNCYVAVSEIAKSHTKSPRSGVMGKTLVAGVLACVLSCGAVIPAYAAIAQGDTNPVTGGEVYEYIKNGNIIPYISINSNNPSNKDSSNAYDDGSIAIGTGSAHGVSSVSIGTGAGASGDGTIAIGHFASASEKSVVIGSQGSVLGGMAVGSNSVVVGFNANTMSENSVAIGSNAAAVSSNSVAIGFKSLAPFGSDNIVSFGHKVGEPDSETGAEYTADLTRRLINVTDGSSASDAATVGQTIELVAGDNVTIAPDTTATNSIGQKRYKISAASSGGGSTPYVGINSAAGGANEDGSGAVGTDAIAIGKSALASDEYAVAIGSNASTKPSTNSNDSSIAIGRNAKAWADENDTVTDSAISAIAIGLNAKAEGTGAISIGYVSQAKSTSGVAFGRYSKALGASSTALGSEAVANGTSDVAIGFDAKTAENKQRSTAIGSSSFSNANGSVALGNKSTASERYVVSVGHLVGDLKSNGTAYEDTLKRRIVSVEDGTASHNAATVGQTIELVAGDNVTVTEDGTNSIGQKKYKLSASGGSEIHGFSVGISPSESNYNNDGTSGVNNHSIAIGGGASAGGNHNVAIGYGAIASDNGHNVVMGTNAKSNGGSSVAIGLDATVEEGFLHSVAIGSNTKAKNGDSIVIGDAAEVSGKYSIALGTQTKVQGEHSVALGDTSTAVENFVISVGSSGLQRRIVNVKDGVNATDAATVAQTSTLSTDNDSGISLTSTTNTNGSRNYNIGIVKNGSITPESNGLLAGAQVYYEVRPTSNGHYIKTSNSAAGNLATLDAALYGETHVTQDGHYIKTSYPAAGNLATLDAAFYNETHVTQNGNYIKTSYPAAGNLTVLDAAIKNVSDRIDGIDIPAPYTAGNNIFIENNVVSAVGLVKYDGEDKSTATLEGSKGTKLTNLKAAELSKSSKDAVIGNQLWTTNENMAGMKKDITTNKDNISALNSSMTNALESVSTLNTLVNTIDTLKADASLNNLTNSGKQVIAAAAANAVQEYMAGNGKVVPVNKLMSKVSLDKTIGSDNVVAYDDVDASTITLEGEVGVGTKIMNVADGELTAGSMDAVNGSQLYAVQQQFDTFQSSLSTNNATIASVQTDVNTMKTNYLNLNSNVNTLQTQMETGFNVTIDGAKVKTVNPEANNINFIAGDNVSLVNENGSVKISFTGGAGGSDASKANADASNVADHTADWGAAIGTGAVEAGNGELVTGDTVYNALEDTKSEMQDALDTKADKDSVYTKDETDTLLSDKADRVELDTKADISYVDEGLAGKADKDSVYTKDETDGLLDAKADKSELDAKANVDASNIEADAWADKLGVGAVEEGNTGLVNGGTVYEALQGVSGNDVIKAGTDAIEIGSKAKYDNLDAVSIAKSDGSGRVLRGVIVDPADNNSAVNVGYVNGIADGLASGMNRGFAKLDSKINKTGAGAAALANLHPLNDDGDTKWNVAAGFGRYHGESAGALGVFYKPSDRVAMNISSTVGNSDTMFGAGVTFAVDKPMANGLSKVEMAKTINAQANEIQQMKQHYEGRIAKLEAMVAEMAKK